MKRALEAAMLVAIVAVVAAILYALWMYSDDCQGRGGVLVRSVWGYECVEAK